MNQDRLAKRIADWVANELPEDTRPCIVEVRSGIDVIDAFDLLKDSEPLAFAHDLIECANEDASDEGRSRSYTIIAILKNDQRFFCPVRVRCKASQGDKGLVTALTKMTTDLHESLRKERTEAYTMLLKYAERLDASHKRVSDENERNSARMTEVITRLEDLRSKQLERDLAREKHEKDIEIRERITDAVVPLAVAIGSRLTKGTLPAPNTEDLLLVQTIKSLTEEQLPLIQQITGSQWPAFERIISMGLNGAADVKGFKEAVQRLSPEQLMAITQAMNMGQQAALQELLTNDRANGTSGN